MCVRSLFVYKAAINHEYIKYNLAGMVEFNNLSRTGENL